MRHAIYIVVMLMVCTIIKAQTGDTYYESSGVMTQSSFLYNDGSGISIGTFSAPTAPYSGAASFIVEIAGQMRTNFGNYYAESSSGDFGKLTSLFGITPPFMAGSGNYYTGSDFRILSGVLDASSLGANSIGAAGGIFDLDGSAGYFAGRNIANTENVLEIQHFYDDGTTEHGKTFDLENNRYQLLAEGVLSGTSTTTYYNSIELTNTGVDLLATDGTTTSSLSLQNDGHINIGDKAYVGTPHNDYLLGVSGKVIAYSYVANATPADWADFVFDENYKLKPLSEVKAFINNNGHLPDVPSAEEVGENGINLAKTDAMLLMKIEELTLYLLQQQEEIEALKLQLEQK